MKTIKTTKDEQEMATCAYLSYKMLNIKPENQEKHKEKRQIYT